MLFVFYCFDLNKKVSSIGAGGSWVLKVLQCSPQAAL